MLDLPVIAGRAIPQGHWDKERELLGAQCGLSASKLMPPEVAQGRIFYA
jgi:hypothetical protein